MSITQISYHIWFSVEIALTYTQPKLQTALGERQVMQRMCKYANAVAQIRILAGSLAVASRPFMWRCNRDMNPTKMPMCTKAPMLQLYGVEQWHWSGTGPEQNDAY